MVYHPYDAEDATQEVLIKLLTKLSTFEGRSSFRTWLYRIVVNHVLNMKRARAEAEESVTHFYRLQYELIAESARRSGRQSFIDRAEKLRTLTYADALRGNVLVGTPDSVSATLMRLRDEIGFDGILAELNCGGLIPHNRVMNAIRLLCQEVMPRFR